MKKTYTIIFFTFLILTFNVGFSQVSTYFFNQTQSVYSAISGGTVYGNAVTDDQIFVNPALPLGSGANGTGIGLSIGFNFEFNYTIYDRIGINANGWITFGQSTLSPCVNMNSNNNFACLSDTANASTVHKTRISALCQDIQGQVGSEIRIETIGTAPNRVCVVQWTKYRKYNNSGDDINFQIRLNETTNIVDIVYGTFINNANVSKAQVGLRGFSNLDFNNRNVNGTNVWGNSIAGITNTTVANFNIVLVPTSGLRYEWTPLPACSGTPAFNSLLVTSPLVCQGGSSSLSLSNLYNNSGIVFQWTSASSSTGPFSAVFNATNSVYTPTAISATTWYQCIITCSNSASSTTTSPISVNVVSTVTNNVPYFEGFEGLLVNNQLPNCSWNVSSPNNICQTYISAPAAPVYNRVPFSGNKFASFKFGANDYFYSSGLKLNSGVTYSANVWYITDGALGWTNLSLFYGTSQSSSSLMPIAATTAANLTNTNYLPLSGTFTVPVSGIYYIALRGQGSNSPKYLSWDDLSVTIPCNLNPPAIVLNPSNPSVCAGQTVNISASGASSYTWSNGSNGSSISVSPTVSTTYSLIATNSLGCVSQQIISSINVLASPTISIISNYTTICAGQAANQIAIGANSYTWSNGATTFSIAVSPTTSTTYSVNGANSNGCVGSAIQTISVGVGPPITLASSSSVICNGQTASLTASGGNSYQWSGSASSFSLGAEIVVSPSVTTTYTLNAISSTGCPLKFSYTQVVNECVGLQSLNNLKSFYQVFPNPSSGLFLLDLKVPYKREMEVVDFSGRLILSETHFESKVTLDMSKFANGIYYLKIKSTESHEVIKLIRE